MLFSEIIYDLQNLKEGGKQSDDNSLSNRELAFLINSYRSILIRQEVNKGYKIDGSLVQSLVKIEVVKTTLDNDFIGDCFLYKPLKRLPDFIIGSDAPLSTYIGNTDGCAFQKTTRQINKLDRHLPYTGKEIRWFNIENNFYISCPENKTLKYIGVSGVFEKPEEVRAYNNQIVPFEYYDFHYPVKMHMVPIIKQMIIEADFKFLMNNKQDTVNDSQES
jgi:hypothetical protein